LKALLKNPQYGTNRARVATPDVDSRKSACCVRLRQVSLTLRTGGGRSGITLAPPNPAVRDGLQGTNCTDGQARTASRLINIEGIALCQPKSLEEILSSRASTAARSAPSAEQRQLSPNAPSNKNGSADSPIRDEG